jgi:hypothetical protein
MMANREPTVYTVVPTVQQRARGQWRLAYARLSFGDGTTGVIALACAPMLTTPERMLRDTAEVILRGMMLTYPDIAALGVEVVTDTYRDIDGSICTSLVHVDSLTTFERKHTIEYSSLYFQHPFLERLEVAYERVVTHDEVACDDFVARVDRISTAQIHKENVHHA